MPTADMILYNGRIHTMRYSPYDLLYVQADGKNTMSTAEASRLLSEYGVSVSADGETPFLRNGAFNLFPASELNRIAGAGYDVKPGEYLALYQYDLKDGYEHEMNLSGTMRFTLKTGNLALAYAGTDVRVFFNRGSFADVSLVLNDADYKTMKELTGSAARILAFAIDEGGSDVSALGKGLTLVGIVAIKDEVRREAARAIRQVNGGGIQVVMAS